MFDALVCFVVLFGLPLMLTREGRVVLWESAQVLGFLGCYFAAVFAAAALVQTYLFKMGGMDTIHWLDGQQ